MIYKMANPFETTEEIVTKKINEISFGVVSPTMVRKMGVINVTTPEIYDADGYPVRRGLMDPRMGVIDPGLRCKTCGSGLKTCPGHFGYISLSKPVVHILYINHIYDFLRSFCAECGRILTDPTKFRKWEENIILARKEHDLDAIRNISKEVIKRARAAKKCHHCGEKYEEVKIIKPTTFMVDDKRLWPTEIRERLEKIPDDDLALLGFDPTSFRPEWTIIDLLLVPPITMRPSITLETGERSEDDLTHKLSDVVRVNQRLLENINAGAPEIIVEDLWDLLQYHITTYFDNKVAQIPPARHRTRRQLKTLAQRLSGKEGRFRYNLAGKRVNFCARSVISPDPFIEIDELGVPLIMAKELTVPEKVTEWNKKWLISLIKRGSKYPGANYVVTPDKKRKKITEDTEESILEDLDIGWIVERQIVDGDIVILNRQPSLHKLSMMGHRVKIVPGRTLRLNPIVCLPYNADFDGDEMNMHVPQNEESKAEAENLMLLRNQIITPRYGLSIIGGVQDVLLGIYYLTKNMWLTKKETLQLLVDAGLDDKYLPKPEKNGLWNGKQIFSMLLPRDLSMTSKGKVISDGRVTSGIVEIRNGLLIKGVMDKKFIGEEAGVLTHRIYSKYGADKAAEFLNKMNRLSLAVGRKIAYTVSFYDLDISGEDEKKIKRILNRMDSDAEKLIKQYKSKKIIPMPGQTVRETFEAKMLAVLSEARNKLGDIIERDIREDSTIVNSARAGAGDRILNIALMSGFAGQQVLRGGRIEGGYSGRTLPHFKVGDLSPDSHGFIRKGYAHGINPIELFFNAVVGRDSYMDTAMRTPKSGYMQRRLINSLQDLKVEYDGTVRDSGGKIIQFKFGGDNIDVSKSDGGKLDVE